VRLDAVACPEARDRVVLVDAVACPEARHRVVLVDAVARPEAHVVTAAVIAAAVGWTVALGALAAVAALRVSGERRMALVAEAAHELRRPLSAAMLGLHGVAADAPAARRVAAVELELRRAALALEDLDAAPRGRRAHECARPLELRALLADAVEGWRPLAGALAAELVFDPGGARLLVNADPLRLTQAVGNLVFNALEHGAGPVRLRAHATRTHVRIEVRDHGPGLPPPVAALAGGGARGGRRGHGLAIAERVVRRHGGRLLTAPVSSGACVVVELPRADGAPREPLGHAERRPRRRRKAAR
jgi:signal transduction histidine kinase